MIAVLVAKFIVNDLPHAAGLTASNPNTTGDMTSDIIARAGLKEYEYRWFPAPEEERKPRVYPFAKTRNIGTYSIVMRRTDGSCTVRLYEFLEGGKKVLRGTWTGLEVHDCERKFAEVIDTVIQVRFEHKVKIQKLREELR